VRLSARTGTLFKTGACETMALLKRSKREMARQKANGSA
jgi:hypothetical protein